VLRVSLAIMRILHTADWHLGHTLREHARSYEHAAFLAWLVATVVEREVDALLIAGDVFDAANPPPDSLRAWFQFLGDLKRARPSVQVVVIAGNHDSGARLAAPRELLAAFDVRILGGGPGGLEPDELTVPLRERAGKVAAWCVAIPFLRASDVMAAAPIAPATPTDGDRIPRPHDAMPGVANGDDEDPLIAGMRALHARLFTAALAKRQPGQALVAMAHGYLVGGAISELSERKVLGGNQHALPLDLFPPACAYVALGHLHRPQPLAGREHVRYAGSPIPLSMPERLHAHHVVFCDLEGERVAKIWSLRVPRTVELLRLPEHGELTSEAAFAAVAALPPRDPTTPAERLPFVEIAVRLAQPAPVLAEQLARAIADRAARLVRVELVTGAPVAVDSIESTAELASLSPEQVFLRRYRRDHAEPPPEHLLRAFRELLEQVQHEGTA
jgi:DNA repair protein SbcD/Mre11